MASVRDAASNIGAESTRQQRAVAWWLGDGALVPVAVVAVLADLVMRSATSGTWQTDHWLRFGASAVVSVALASVLVRLSTRLRRVSASLATGVVVCVAFLWTWIVAGSLGYYGVLHTWPVATAVQYIVDEPLSSWNLATPYLFHPAVLSAFVVLPAVIAWWWHRATVRASGVRAEPSTGGWRRAVWPRVVVAIGAFVFLAAKPVTYSFAVADVHAVLLGSNLVRLAAVGDAFRLQIPHRIKLEPKPLPDDPAQRPPNVLLIVNESLGHSAVGHGAPGFGTSRFDTTPRLDKFLKRNADNVVLFDNAQSNSGATLVSIVTMMTGVAPEQKARVHHTAPVLWQYFKAAGYRTLLYSAQSYAWLQFDKFLLGDGLDALWYRENSGLPVANDAGVADDKMVDAALKHLDAVLAKRDKPFLGVIHFNATHSPFLQHPDHRYSWPKDRGPHIPRYLDAVRLIDDLTAQIVERVERAGALKRTLIVLTSDHAQGMAGMRGRTRLVNYYDEIQRIPFFVHLPSSASSVVAARQTVVANKRRRISNLDIVPTLIDVAGLRGHVPENVTKMLDGNSLLEPIPEPRTLSFLNVNGFRNWDYNGFTLVHGGDKYIFFDRATGCVEELYRVADDPDENNDLWKSATEQVKRTWYRRVRAKPWLKQMREKRRCPPDPALWND